MSEPPRTRLGPRLELLALVVWTLVLFAAALPGDYLSDDYFLITQVCDVDGAPDLGRALAFWWEGPSEYAPQFVRPVWRASYLLDAVGVQVGLGAPASRLVELLLHALCAWLLLRWLVSLGAGRGAARFAAFLFVLVPLGTEAVLWIAGRTDLLSTAGVLAALWLRARMLETGDRRSTSELGVWAAVVVGLWTKETAAIAGPLLLAQELLHPARAELSVVERLRASSGFLARGAVLALAMLLHRRWLLDEWVGGYQDGRTGLEGHVYGLGRNVHAGAFPASFFRDEPPSGPWTDRLAVAALVVSGLLVAWRRVGVPARLCAAFWILSLLVLAGLHVDYLEAPNTRLLYQPSVAWIALLALALGGLHRVRTDSPAARGTAQALGVALFVIAFERHAPWTADHREAALELQRFRAAVAERIEASEASLLFVGLPESRGRAYSGLNVFSSLLEPPFVERDSVRGQRGSRVAGWTDRELEEGPVTMSELSQLFAPRREIWEWDGAQLLRRDDLPPVEEPLPRFELRFERDPRGGHGELVVEGAGPGSVLVLLHGRPGAAIDLGLGGTLELADAIGVEFGRADASGRFRVSARPFAKMFAGSDELGLQVVGYEGANWRMSNAVDIR